jgi:methionyl-tRNA formyltransferase
MIEKRTINFDIEGFDVYVMGQKGLYFLKGFISSNAQNKISTVVSSRDSRILNDHYLDIEHLAKSHGLSFLDRKEALSSSFLRAEFAFAASWRWKIEHYPTLVVLHDSLLPKYRGFNPLVSALIEGDSEVGVTAVIANPEYDRGDIIDKIYLPVKYPVKIAKAILDIAAKYQQLGEKLGQNIADGASKTAEPQKASEATYSVWRDDDDYWTQWEWDSKKIKRFIDASGHPYLGARTLVGEREVIIHDVEIVEDVIVANRDSGKIVFMDGKFPVVICGSGLLKITNAVFRDTKESCIGQIAFRTRFKSLGH